MNFKNRSSERFFFTNNSMNPHLLSINDLSVSDIYHLFNQAQYFKTLDTDSIDKVLYGKTVVLAFFEASTRTRISFEIACKRLGAHTIIFQSNGSSVSKGESLIDTVHTLNQMHIDMWIVRHPHSGAAQIICNNVKGHVINAGDGQNQHPTQALLDAFTLYKHYANIQEKKITIVGDILHSRVARSSIQLFQKLGLEVGICSPGIFIPKNIKHWDVRFFSRLSEALEWTDIVSMLRVQKERMQDLSRLNLQEYSRHFGLTHTLLEQYSDLIVLHPGPANYGMEIQEGIMNNPRVLIREQVNNGLDIRMAVLSSLITNHSLQER